MGMDNRRKVVLWSSLGVLLISAFALISHADELSIWSDEMWSVFHSSKSVTQILLDRDVTWPFTYYLALHGWSRVASWNDFVLHAFGVFAGVLTVAFMIQAGRRLLSPTAGLLAALAFGTSSYALYFLLELRGYSLMLLTEAAFVYCYLRWRKNPSLRRSAVLWLSQVAMLYTQFILVVILMLAALHLLLTMPRRFLRWLIITLLTGVAFLPLLPQFLRGVNLRSTVGDNGSLPSYFLYGFDSFYRAYSAHWDIWFAVLLGLVGLGLLWAVRRFGWLTLLWLLIWGVGIPLAAYIEREHFAAFTTRYLSFTMPAAFLLIGAGLAALPRRTYLIGAATLLILALAPWQPFDHRPKYSDYVPTRDFMREMARAFQPGDYLVVDPSLQNQVDSLEWWYYKTLYFPSGNFQIAPDGAKAGRRVWYLVRQGSDHSAIAASVQQGRLMRSFWGPWYFIATLYEAPPLAQGIRFGDTMRFRGADVVRTPVVHAGDTLDVTLWWSTDEALKLNYSISMQLLDSSGRLITQVDRPPQGDGTPEQISTWQPNMLYLDHRRIEIPYHLADGQYRIELIVYQYWDNVRLMPETGASPDRTLTIDQFHLLSYAVW